MIIGQLWPFLRIVTIWKILKNWGSYARLVFLWAFPNKGILKKITICYFGFYLLKIPEHVSMTVFHLIISMNRHNCWVSYSAFESKLFVIIGKMISILLSIFCDDDIIIWQWQGLHVTLTENRLILVLLCYYCILLNWQQRLKHKGAMQFTSMYMSKRKGYTLMKNWNGKTSERYCIWGIGEVREMALCPTPPPHDD